VSEEEKAKFEARLMMASRISLARFNEQKRIGGRIEQMLYETKSVEVADALVALARYVFDEGKA